MFCSKCKSNYRDGILICPECEEELVEELKKSVSVSFNPDEKICTLCTAGDEFEADIIISKLRSEGIYASKKFKGSDDYGRIILGRTVLGVEIQVGESNLAEAENIIKS